MKKIKALLSIVLTVILMFALTACGSKKEVNVSSDKKDLKGSTIKIIGTSKIYQKLFDKFTKETGIKVESLSMSSGEVLSRTKAEDGKPMGDVWFGGGIDAFMSAKNQGLLEKYLSPESKDVSDSYKDKEGYWIAKGVTIVGFLVNNDVMKEKNLEIPKSWEDLTKPQYKDEILMSNPAISGTNYAVVHSLLGKMGKEKGWSYFEKLNKNIPYYSKRGKDPQLKVSAGEIGIGITYVDNTIVKLEKEKNVQVVYPEDGIPWVPEGMAIFKDCTNLEGAKAFEDWVLQKDNQQYLAELEGKDGTMMVRPGVKGMDLKVPKDKFIEEYLGQFGKYRDEILDKWKVITKDK
ncbi:ABC transporter substrate-binding protein [Clostridium oceanicum]|uniref:ABC transporter substrate-binding protein n=1 Tax=Clostridium oceanicum TaxID=1543 RepID=A0ABP3ULJ3_9CLOT